MRFAIVFRFKRRRSDIGIDSNNLLNTNDSTGYNSMYTFSAGNTGQGGTWGAPTSIDAPRVMRINDTLGF